MYPGLSKSLVPQGYHQRRYPAYYPPATSLTRYARPPFAQDYHKYKSQSRRKRPGSRHSMLKDCSLPFSATPSWNIDYATAQLIDHIHKTDTNNAEKCKSAIGDCLSSLANDGSMFEAFELLDHAIFDNKLRGAVFMAWTDVRLSGYAATYAPGVRFPRIAILLDSEFSRVRNAGVYLSTLLHQMIHAYFLVTCVPPSEGVKDARLDHGKHFLKICSVLRDLSVQEKDQTIQPDFGAVVMKDVPNNNNPWAITMFGSPSTFQHRHHHHDFYSRFNDTITKDTDGKQSNCGSKPTETVQQADIDKWYTSTCEPLLKAKSCQGPNTNVLAKGNKLEIKPRDTFAEPIHEFILDDKPIAFPCSALSRYPQSKKLKRIVPIPKSCPKETFFALTDFITTSTYSPDLSSFPYRTTGSAPIILPRSLDAAAQAHALAHVRVAKLALALPCPELATEALKRLHDLPDIREDAVVVLDEIYSASLAYGKVDKDKGYAAPEGLRAWVRHLLAREPEHAGLGLANWDVLACEPGFARLMRGNAELGQDVEVVEGMRAQRAYARGGGSGGGPLDGFAFGLGQALPGVDVYAAERLREIRAEERAVVARAEALGALSPPSGYEYGFRDEPFFPAAGNYGSYYHRSERFP
ncbi:hypothetical protein EJ05DRAFT_15526 [Pseudovirgaria hyperparasitica]|uniref:Uncharacterized protein n=1 Tax=Pseudovirgaria hyperparasitica TaxID=470096 RepID=A0A6A6WKU8_9PEZI|nr:uncharacterized protein EJ05DRAFT_15526 [Pseudovirgaria hyperparasitica]KAF2762792.1 hypothetical protein EJ05DRAFT_15526 [Pseudovirgaria hyperparasitica]